MEQDTGSTTGERTKQRIKVRRRVNNIKNTHGEAPVIEPRTKKGLPNQEDVSIRELRRALTEELNERLTALGPGPYRPVLPEPREVSEYRQETPGDGSAELFDPRKNQTKISLEKEDLALLHRENMGWAPLTPVDQSEDDGVDERTRNWGDEETVPKEPPGPFAKYPEPLKTFLTIGPRELIPRLLRNPADIAVGRDAREVERYFNRIKTQAQTLRAFQETNPDRDVPYIDAVGDTGLTIDNFTEGLAYHMEELVKRYRNPSRPNPHIWRHWPSDIFDQSRKIYDTTELYQRSREVIPFSFESKPGERFVPLVWSNIPPPDKNLALAAFPPNKQDIYDRVVNDAFIKHLPATFNFLNKKLMTVSGGLFDPNQKLATARTMAKGELHQLLSIIRSDPLKDPSEPIIDWENLPKDVAGLAALKNTTMNLTDEQKERKMEAAFKTYPIVNRLIEAVSKTSIGSLVNAHPSYAWETFYNGLPENTPPTQRDKAMLGVLVADTVLKAGEAAEYIMDTIKQVVDRKKVAKGQRDDETPHTHDLAFIPLEDAPVIMDKTFPVPSENHKHIFKLIDILGYYNRGAIAKKKGPDNITWSYFQDVFDQVLGKTAPGDNRTNPENVDEPSDSFSGDEVGEEVLLPPSSDESFKAPEGGEETVSESMYSLVTPDSERPPSVHEQVRVQIQNIFKSRGIQAPLEDPVLETENRISPLGKVVTDAERQLNLYRNALLSLSVKNGLPVVFGDNELIKQVTEAADGYQKRLESLSFRLFLETDALRKARKNHEIAIIENRYNLEEASRNRELLHKKDQTIKKLEDSLELQQFHQGQLLTMANEQIRNMSAEIEKLEEEKVWDRHTHLQEIVRFRESLEEMLSENAKVKEMVYHLKENPEEWMYNSDFENTLTELVQMVGRLADLKTTGNVDEKQPGVNELRAINQTLKKQVEELQEITTSQRVELQDLKGKEASRQQELWAHRDMIKTLGADNLNLHKQIKEYEEEKHRLLQTSSDQKDEEKRLQRMVGVLRLRLKNALKNASEADTNPKVQKRERDEDLSALKVVLEEKNTQIQQDQETIKRSENEVAQLNARLETLHDEMAALKESKEDSNRTEEALRNKIKDYEEEELKVEAERQHHLAFIRSLEAKVASLTFDRDRLIIVSGETNISHTETRELLTAELDRLTAKLENANEIAEAKLSIERKALEVEYAEKNQQLAAREAAINANISNANNTARVLGATVAQVGELERELAISRENERLANTNTEAVRTQLLDTSAALQASEARVQELMEELTRYHQMDAEDARWMNRKLWDAQIDEIKKTKAEERATNRRAVSQSHRNENVREDTIAAAELIRAKTEAQQALSDQKHEFGIETAKLKQRHDKELKVLEERLRVESETVLKKVNAENAERIKALEAQHLAERAESHRQYQLVSKELSRKHEAEKLQWQTSAEAAALEASRRYEAEKLQWEAEQNRKDREHKEELRIARDQTVHEQNVAREEQRQKNLLEQQLQAAELRAQAAEQRNAQLHAQTLELERLRAGIREDEARTARQYEADRLRFEADAAANERRENHQHEANRIRFQAGHQYRRLNQEQRHRMARMNLDAGLRRENLDHQVDQDLRRRGEFGNRAMRARAIRNAEMFNLVGRMAGSPNEEVRAAATQLFTQILTNMTKMTDEELRAANADEIINMYDNGEVDRIIAALSVPRRNVDDALSKRITDLENTTRSFINMLSQRTAHVGGSQAYHPPRRVFIDRNNNASLHAYGKRVKLSRPGKRRARGKSLRKTRK